MHSTECREGVTPRVSVIETLMLLIVDCGYFFFRNYIWAWAHRKSNQ